jgi:short subunit fatty acids transporter
LQGQTHRIFLLTIPLLGMARLSFRDIMGYGMGYFLIYMVIISIGLLLLPVFFAVA